MESAKLYELALWASLSFNGFLGTYFLAGIKNQMKFMRKEITEVRAEQNESKLERNTTNYRLTALEADYKDLPCMQKEPTCSRSK